MIALRAHGKINALQQKVDKLYNELNQLRAWRSELEGKTQHTPRPIIPDIREQPRPQPPTPQTTQNEPPDTETSDKTFDSLTLNTLDQSATEPPSEATIDAHPDHTTAFADHLKQHWMSWLGGLCVALAGIFLARHAIEQGLIGPRARITFGLVIGIFFHLTALYLRNKHGPQPALAALAGGASITLYGAFFAALHLYQLFHPELVFVGLALVAVATMWLALLHGPLLAALGMLGAYVVPILVSSDGGGIVAALLYALIVSYTALAVAYPSLVINKTASSLNS